MGNRRKIGTEYEQKTAEYLESLGWKILERNYRCRIGEIDLIALDGRTLVFVEVKYRRSGACGSPGEAVDVRKQHTICRVADYYRMVHGISETQSCRFDVAAVQGERLELLRNAFPYRQKPGGRKRSHMAGKGRKYGTAEMEES